MQGKIGLEEHFAIPETLGDSKGFLSDAVWPELERRLLDIQDYRLRQMDENGMELMLLSLNAPAVQAIPDPARAAAVARRANDFLAEEVRKRPRRFQGLAALAILYAGVYLALGGLGAGITKDEVYFWPLVEGFGAMGWPTLEQLSDYRHLTTPLSLLIFGWVERATTTVISSNSSISRSVRSGAGATKRRCSQRQSPWAKSSASAPAWDAAARASAATSGATTADCSTTCFRSPITIHSSGSAPGAARSAIVCSSGCHLTSSGSTSTAATKELKAPCNSCSNCRVNRPRTTP